MECHSFYKGLWIASKGITSINLAQRWNRQLVAILYDYSCIKRVCWYVLRYVRILRHHTYKISLLSCLRLINRFC